jgi:hypothetical protein
MSATVKIKVTVNNASATFMISGWNVINFCFAVGCVPYYHHGKGGLKRFWSWWSLLLSLAGRIAVTAGCKINRIEISVVEAPLEQNEE